MSEHCGCVLKANGLEVETYIDRTNCRWNAVHLQRARLLTEIDALRAELTASAGALHIADVVLRAEIERLKGIVVESNEVCFCGCPADYHEDYGEDGEGCGGDDHQCVRTCVAVRDMAASLRAEIATFRNASPSLCNCSQGDNQCACGKRKEFAE